MSKLERNLQKANRNERETMGLIIRIYIPVQFTVDDESIDEPRRVRVVALVAEGSFEWSFESRILTKISSVTGNSAARAADDNVDGE